MNYDAKVITLPPGQTVTVPFVGTTVAVLAADNDFRLGVNDNDPRYIESGLKLSPKGGFNKVRLLNPHVTEVVVTLGLAYGDITDSRLQSSGIIEVRDPNGGGESFADVIASQNAILAMMQNDKDQRKPISIIGESFATGVTGGANVPVEIINPTMNVAGAIIRTVEVLAGGYSAVFVDVGAPAAYNDATKKRLSVQYNYNGSGHQHLAGRYVPAGSGLWLVSSTAGEAYCATWDILS